MSPNPPYSFLFWFHLFYLSSLFALSLSWRPCLLLFSFCVISVVLAVFFSRTHANLHICRWLSSSFLCVLSRLLLNVHPLHCSMITVFILSVTFLVLLFFVFAWYLMVSFKQRTLPTSHHSTNSSFQVLLAHLKPLTSFLWHSLTLCVQPEFTSPPFCYYINHSSKALKIPEKEITFHYLAFSHSHGSAFLGSGFYCPVHLCSHLQIRRKTKQLKNLPATKKNWITAPDHSVANTALVLCLFYSWFHENHPSLLSGDS